MAEVVVEFLEIVVLGVDGVGERGATHRHAVAPTDHLKLRSLLRDLLIVFRNWKPSQRVQRMQLLIGVCAHPLNGVLAPDVVRGLVAADTCAARRGTRHAVTVRSYVRRNAVHHEIRKEAQLDAAAGWVFVAPRCGAGLGAYGSRRRFSRCIMRVEVQRVPSFVHVVAPRTERAFSDEVGPDVNERHRWLLHSAFRHEPYSV
mmetsp:Transcript_42743/g.131997  ORF Transcript_42743/g.131997 Transcript_42743/m.131997 type:complete len:202 (-) Transcript_42743:744-1349(-)